MTAALAAIPAILALAGSPAIAGVGIQAGPVCPPTTVAQGASVPLPPVQVSDSGSGGVSISLAVIRQSDPRGLPGKPVPASWVTFTYPRTWGGLLPGSSVGVSPGEAALVPARLAIPSSAATGAYVAWIQPRPAGAPVTGHANFGGSGVADLEFTVTRSGTPPRAAVCVTPGARQMRHAKAARLASQTTPHHRHHAEAASLPPAVKGTLVPLIGAGLALLLLRAAFRRRGTL